MDSSANHTRSFRWPLHGAMILENAAVRIVGGVTAGHSLIVLFENLNSIWHTQVSILISFTPLVRSHHNPKRFTMRRGDLHSLAYYLKYRLWYCLPSKGRGRGVACDDIQVCGLPTSQYSSIRVSHNTIPRQNSCLYSVARLNDRIV